MIAHACLNRGVLWKMHEEDVRDLVTLDEFLAFDCRLSLFVPMRSGDAFLCWSRQKPAFCGAVADLFLRFCLTTGGGSSCQNNLPTTTSFEVVSVSITDLKPTECRMKLIPAVSQAEDVES
ncbi:hypothetical protein Zmor_015262 [Zophobas morio]|uniref:Uncharacterized protein n=1 Tax=Zophobas morio TaxID=2755281 RepID=A0AA38MGF1_9CUCU|nr:hypothetical protein Zmor_015262 [Zophobas morio]